MVRSKTQYCLAVAIGITLVLFVAACGKMAVGGSAAPDLADDVADTIYVGGDILTMQGDTPQYVEALAVKDGEILFVGGKADAEVAVHQLAAADVPGT